MVNKNKNSSGSKFFASPDPYFKDQSSPELLKLYDADFKLIHLIRAIEFGEIENIKIEDGKVVSYKTAWKTGELV